MNEKLIEKGSLLLNAEPGLHEEELVGEIRLWFSALIGEARAGGLSTLPHYRREALCFLAKELREKRRTLRRSMRRREEE